MKTNGAALVVWAVLAESNLDAAVSRACRNAQREAGIAGER